MVFLKKWRERLKGTEIESLVTEYDKNKQMLFGLLKGNTDVIKSDFKEKNSELKTDDSVLLENTTSSLKRNQKVLNGHVLNLNGYKEKKRRE